MKEQTFLKTPIKFIIMAMSLAMFTTACDDDDDDVDTKSFTVTIQNVSTSTTLELGASPDRTVPLSPGVWAVYESGSLFELNQQANLATERQAEEGMPGMKTDDLNDANWVRSNGEFASSGGTDGSIIGAGESVSFTFNAEPGDHLQIMTMFGQSNDWFYAFNGNGLDLFNGDDPINGDVTSSIELYDAGTELDELPGFGLTQKVDHQTTINIGPVDLVNSIKVAASRHTTFNIPGKSSVIKVTIATEQ